MLVLSRKVHHLGHLGFGDFVGECATDSDAAGDDVQHDAGGFVPIFWKKRSRTCTTNSIGV